MQVTVIRKNELNIFTLPKEVSGNFWITDYENGRKINLVNIEATKEGWQLISNQDAFVVDPKNIMIPYVILRDYSFYLLNNNYKNEKYYIYCSPVYDTTYKEFGMDTKPITVGSGKDNEISYGLNGVPGKSFSLQKVNQGFMLTILDNKSAVYVNHKRVLQSKLISYGDIIFTFGLKIIPMRRDGVDYFLVNNTGGLLNFNASFVNILPKKSEFVDDNAVINDDLVGSSETFYRTPHFYKMLERYQVQIDAPPAGKTGEGAPMLLTIGPMLTMSLTSVITLFNTFNSIGKNGASFHDALPSMIMGIAMLASCLLWPLLTRAYQKHADKKYEKKRQKAYRRYIDKKEEQINHELINQKNTLLDNYFSIAKCQEIIRGHNIQLWQRRITDSDFLSLPVGFGNLPMQISISYPEEHFSLTEDNLLDMVHELGQKERVLNDVPITYSFYNNVTTGVVGDRTITKAFIDRIVLQVMANYSYDEVKVVTFTSKDNENRWDYIKTIPHSWSNDRSIRFFGSSNDDYREMIYYLEKIFQQRRESDKDGRKMPHYIIITDAIKSIDSYDFIKNIMTTGQVGFSIIMLVDRISALPNECKSFMEVSATECNIFQSVLNSYVQKFYIDPSPIEEIYRCAEELANIPLDIKSEAEASLPNTYQFLEMYQVGKVAQLNSLERWKKSNPVLSLQAPIGIGKSGEIINLDLHEKYHGPHGLIAGTTGSGKSEFIITFILSLAVNYHPYEVQVILIDYKGGSLAGAFLTDQYRLPHLAGTITNLDGNELNRSLASIESEVKRRQKMFNDAKSVANESTIDIYKYQKLWRDGKLKDMEPISHLFIISDEFAELKEQQPEFMDKLISVARVGRSLGVHLILATQKPGGVVDSQIWSNTRFRVCLKVQDTSDSQEVLKKSDAAYLKRTGRFYLQVGFDEVYTLGQSAWAGGQYYPNTTFKREVDASVNTINNIAYITMTKDNKVQEVVESMGEELPNVVEYLSEIAAQEDIHVRRLWLDKIPARIYIDSLKTKYQYERVLFELNPVIGEYDDPSSQNQFLLTVPFNKSGNGVIYGIAGSGKENFLISLIYSCMTTYAPEEVNFYLIDFGAETLRMFKDSPYVGDIVFSNDVEKMNNLFKLLTQELEYRKGLFASYGGNYQSYIQSKQEHLPNLVIMINNYEVMNELYDGYVDLITQITRDCFKYGIYFLFTATAENSIRFKLRQNLAMTFVLQQNSDSDYSTILGNCRGKSPAKFKGRGLFRSDKIYEFQTAFVVKNDAQLNEYVTNYCKTIASKVAYRAKAIPVLPKEVNYEYIKSYLDGTMNLPIGVQTEQLSVEKYNFAKNVINLVSSYDIETAFPFVSSLGNEMCDLDCDFLFLNGSELDFSSTSFAQKVYTSGFDEVIDSIFSYSNQVMAYYQSNGSNFEVIRNQKRVVCFLYGASLIHNKLKQETFNKLSQIVTQSKITNVISFVLIDSPDAIRNFSYEEWFKNGVDQTRGIWIGSGITDQTLLRVSKTTRKDREEISPIFGYLVNNGKLFRIKLLTSYQSTKGS